MMSATAVIVIGLLVGVTIISIVIFGGQTYMVVTGKAEFMKDTKFRRGSAFNYGLLLF